MRYIITTLAAAVAIVLFAGCGPTTNVDTTVEEGVDLDRYQTFAFDEPPNQDAMNRLRGDVYNEDVRRELAKQLEKEGYTRASDPESADLKVAWYGLVDSETDIDYANVIDDHYTTLGYTWHPYYTHDIRETTVIRQYDQGVVIVDMIDATTDTVVFRGTAQARLDAEVELEERSNKIQQVVEEIFEEFPAES